MLKVKGANKAGKTAISEGRQPAKKSNTCAWREVNH
jgi:hypothetical protein